MVLLEFAMNPPDRGDVLSAYVARIGMNLKMDYKPGTESRLKSKVDAVERHVGRKLRTA